LRAFSVRLVAFMHRNPALARQVARGGTGLHRHGAGRVRFDQFVTGERKLADVRNSRARRTGRIAIVLGEMSLALAVLLIVLLTAYLARRVARPIRLAADAAGRLADGDLSSRGHERGVAQVRALQRAVNSMAAALRRV